MNEASEAAADMTDDVPRRASHLAGFERNRSGSLANRAIGQQLRELRRRRGWTQVEIAATLGLRKGRVSGLERGIARLLYSEAVRFALLFEVDLAALVPPELR